jgi:hypothetical protein
LSAPQVSEHVSLELVFICLALFTNGVCLHVLIEKLVRVQFRADLMSNRDKSQDKYVLCLAPVNKFENLFVKADIVVKNGDCVELIEVKAKPFQNHSSVL